MTVLMIFFVSVCKYFRKLCNDIEIDVHVLCCILLLFLFVQEH